MELEELLATEGLDPAELMTWARTRVDQLLGEGPGEGELEALLQDLPSLRPAATDRELLGEDEDGFSGLRTGNFEAIDEPIADEEEAGAPEELEALQSGEYEMVDADELEELDVEELEEFQSGEYEIVEADEDAAEPKRAGAPPPPPPPGASHAPDDDDDEDDLDIDIDI